MENNIRESIILSALLHEIGKFWQRCEKAGGIDKAAFLSQEVKHTNAADICPNRTWNNETFLTHQHAAWTYQFLTQSESKLFKTGTQDDESVLQLAANHHRKPPSTTLQTIIQAADCISAGQDRNGDVEDIKDELSRSYNYRKQRQRPVFENLFKGDFNNDQKNRYHLESLALNENIFPYDIGTENQDLYPEYQNLWNEFISEFQNLPNSGFDVYLESLIHLLQKYTWCVPSSTNDSPDISLYDHLRSTAAIATCLYDYLLAVSPALVEPGEKTQQARINSFYKSDEKFALLIAADISGIQKFIYQISSVKAATSLKGRSFYLQLISDAAARWLLHRLNLPLTNLIYSSGGNFFLLAPNTKFVREEIKKVRQELNRHLFKKYAGNLFIGIGYEEISGTDFIENLSEKWGSAIQKSGAEKRRRFQDLIINDVSFFMPTAKQAARPCDNCGADCEASELKEIKSGEEEKYCHLCREFIKTGNRLKSAGILLEFIDDGAGKIDKAGGIFPIEGLPVGYLLTNAAELDKMAAQINPAVFKKIHYLNDTDFLRDLHGDRFNAFARGFKFYGGNHLPGMEGSAEPATFDYLAGVRVNKDAEPAFKRLGVLRMDVDNLGKIFSKGFLGESIKDLKPRTDSGKTPYSISRISTLSSMLDIFFSGYLNTLHQYAEFKDNLYILYSGGDDLFIVGRWDKVIDFAALARAEFKDFTCRHPDLSISGGLVLTPPKYPIHRSADLAGEAESQAKAQRDVNGVIREKDAFCFLGKTLRWNDFEVAKALKNDLIKWIKEPENGKKPMNRGLLSRLKQIYATYQKEAESIRKQEKDGQIGLGEIAERIQYNKWRWRLVYSLRRFINQNKDYNDEIQNIQTALCDTNCYGDHQSELPIIEYLDIPVKWAEYQLKTNQKEEQNGN